MFATVNRNNFPSPYELDAGEWTISLKVNNAADPTASDVLVDYVVMLPNDYKEPSILKADVHSPCLAGSLITLFTLFTLFVQHENLVNRYD